MERTTWNDLGKEVGEHVVADLGFWIDEQPHERGGTRRRFVVEVRDGLRERVWVTGHHEPHDWLPSFVSPLSRYALHSEAGGVLGDWITAADLPLAIAEALVEQATGNGANDCDRCGRRALSGTFLRDGDGEFFVCRECER